MTIKLELDLQVAKALQGLASVIAKEGQYDQAILKTIGLTREQAKANTELVKVHQQSNDLVSAFKKHEIELSEKQIAADKRKTAEFVKNRSQERAALSSFISEVKNLNTTPIQQFEARQQKLNTALRAGAIDQKLYNAELSRMKGELEPATKEASSFSAALMSTGAGAMVIQKVSAAISEMKSRLSETRQELSKIAGDNKSMADLDREFLAVSSGGSPAEDAAEVNRRILLANKMSTSFGLSLAESKSVILESQNYGLSDADTESVGKFARLTGSAGDAAKLAGMASSAFSQENLSAAQTSAMVLGAARVGPATPKSMAQFLPPAMVTGGALGMKAVDVASAYSVASSKMGVEKGADRLSMFISRLGDPEAGDTFKNKTIMESAALLKADPQLKEKILGNRIEAGQALAALSAPDSQAIYDKARLSAETEMARAGTAQDPTDQKLAAIRGVPSLAAADRIQRSETTLALAQQRLVPHAAGVEASSNLAKASILNQGLPGIVRTGANKFIDTLMGFAFDKGPLSPELAGMFGAQFGGARGAGFDPLAPGSVGEIGKNMRGGQAGAAGFMKNNLEQGGEVPGLLKQIIQILSGNNQINARAAGLAQQAYSGGAQ